MNKLKLAVSFLLLSLSFESSASLMQLTYDNFYAPPSPTNYPVDVSGVVSFIFDDTIADTDSNPFSGKFINPIKSGYMFLSGIRYDIAVDVPVEFTTQYFANSFGHSSFQATGTIFNSDIGKTNSFSLSLFGDFSADIGNTLASLNLSDCWQQHLVFGDDTFYENGGVSTDLVPDVISVSTQIASVPEPAPIILLLLGVAGLFVFRMDYIKRNAL